MSVSHLPDFDVLPHELADQDLVLPPDGRRRLRLPTMDAVEAFLGSVPATFGILAAAIMVLWGAYFSVPASGPWVASGYCSVDKPVIALLAAGMGLFCLGALRGARQGIRALEEL